MDKRVILITGTPCVGKTTVSKRLAKRLDAFYVNLSELAEMNRLTLTGDSERNTAIIDEDKMRTEICEVIDNAEKVDVIIDAHYAAAVTPKEKVANVFVLRRNPVELHKFMLKCGFKDKKLWENLAAEILDVCLVEALVEQEQENVCELDATGKNPNNIVEEILAVLEHRKKCRSGVIDWLGVLDREGKLEEYMKV